MGIIARAELHRNRWATIRAGIVGIVADVMEQYPDEIVEFNRQQLLDGKDQDDTMFKKYRGREYADYKHYLNSRPEYGHADFKLTGAFQSRMFLRITGNKYEMDSSDEKRDMLVEMSLSKSKIFGLSEQSRHAVWIEILRNPVIERIANISSGRSTI